MALVLVETTSASVGTSTLASVAVGFLRGSIARYAIAATTVCGMVEVGRRCKRRLQQNHQETFGNAKKKRRVQEGDSDAAGPSGGSNKCSTEKMRELEQQVKNLTMFLNQQNDKLKQMPGWSDVGPIISQVRCLEGELTTRPTYEQVATSEQISELRIKIEQKADHAEVVRTQEQLLDLVVKVDQKPNRDEVPTLDQLAELSSELATKPGLEEVMKPSEVVSQDQFMAAINQKPDRDQVASLAQVKQLQNSVADMEKNNAAKMDELSESVKGKPDFEQVPTIVEVQKLSTDMKECVVPGLMQLQELMSAMKDKPGFNQVCTLLDESSMLDGTTIQINDDDWVHTQAHTQMHPFQVTQPIVV